MTDAKRPRQMKVNIAENYFLFSHVLISYDSRVQVEYRFHNTFSSSILCKQTYTSRSGCTVWIRDRRHGVATKTWRELGFIQVTELQI